MHEVKLHLRGGAVITCHVPGDKLELSHDERRVLKLDLAGAEVGGEFAVRFLDLDEIAAVVAREVTFLPEMLAPE